MTERASPGAPAEPEDRPTDPRAVRVTTVGADATGLPPMVVEPGAAARAGDPWPVVDGSAVDAGLVVVGGDRAVLRQGEGRHQVLLPAPDGRIAADQPGVQRREVIVDGWRVEVELESAARAALRDRARRGRGQAGQSGPTEVHAIIPGVVVSVSVAPGDAVTAGQQLLVVEAMKMQNELRSPRDGTIERVAVGAGATIDVGDLLLVIR